jgi:thiol-disulfide isomerase/thioredoxin
VWEYDRPLPGEKIHCSISGSPLAPAVVPISLEAISDENGRFVFNYVPPGNYSLFRMIPTPTGSSAGPNERVEVGPGAKATVKLGGPGRPVVGHFKIKNPFVKIDWSMDSQFCHAEESEQRTALDALRGVGQSRNYPVLCAEDGTFRIDEVPPGKYFCYVNVRDPRDLADLGSDKSIIYEKVEFVVPDSPEANSKIPFNIGVLDVSLKDLKNSKTPAPELEALNLRGEKLKLTNFRGKYVVLDFWATWCAPCVGQLPYLRKVSQKLKTRSDIVMISVSLDKNIEKLRQFLNKNEMPWLQSYLGAGAQDKLPQQFDRGIPAIFLISPDGNLIADDLNAENLGAKLDEISLR